MSSFHHNIAYVPANVDRFIDNFPLIDTDNCKTVDLFLIKNTLIYPKKPISINFTYSKPINCLSKFKSNSLRLTSGLKNLGIFQYDPCIETSHNSCIIYIVNCSSKKITLKKGQLIGKAQVYSNLFINNKKITDSSYHSFESYELSIADNSNDINLSKNNQSKFNNSEINNKNKKNSYNKSNDIPQLLEEKNISNINSDSSDESINSFINEDIINTFEKHKKRADNTSYLRKKKDKDQPSITSTKEGQYKRKRIKTFFSKKRGNKIKDSDNSKIYESVLDFDFDEEYLQKFNDKSHTGKIEEVKKDLKIISERYAMKSNDCYLKIKRLEKKLFNKKGEKKKKINTTYFEINLKELTTLKKEENRFMKNALSKIWKKIENL